MQQAVIPLPSPSDGGATDGLLFFRKTRPDFSTAGNYSNGTDQPDIAMFGGGK